MGTLGTQEMIVIFVLALLVFGPKKLPELGKNLAKALSEFRRASNELKSTWQKEMDSIERESGSLKEAAQQVNEHLTSTYDDASYYDYGAYGSESGTATTTATNVSASATQGAESTPAAVTETHAAQAVTGETPVAKPAQQAKYIPFLGNVKKPTGTQPANS